MKDQTFCIIDVETTGMNPQHDRLIEIGILRVEKGVVVQTYQTMLNPEQRIPGVITSITGITAEEVQNAPTFEEVKDEIWDLIKGSIFVAHNARFDYSFLRSEFKRAGRTLSVPTLCTVKLSRALYPQHREHNLDAIIERFSFACDRRHRAFDDAKVLFEFLETVHRVFPKDAPEKIKTILGKRSLPPQISSELMSGLPETPGIYVFHGPEGEVLYIGKSVNIRSRVQSHFTNSLSSAQEMRLFNQVADITTHQTAGEMGALLLESHLIKELMPLYNRLLRKVKKLVIARRSISKEGYFTITFERSFVEALEDYESVLGIFRSVRQAKGAIEEIAQEAELCQKLVGLEEGGGACFKYQLGKCRGACAALETPLHYNHRFTAAFSERTIRIWPYAGAVVLEEHSDEQTGELFFIYDWRIVGAYHFENDDVSEFLPVKNYFDYESYKIMVQFLLKRQNKKGFKVIPVQEMNKTIAQFTTV